MGFQAVVGAASVVYGCCIGSWDRFRLYVEPRVGGREVVALAGQSSIAAAYNGILDACRGRDADALVLLHDDLELTDPEAEGKLLRALAGDADLVGVAGGRGVASLAWWNAETYGYQRTDTTDLHLGPRHGEVDALEGSLLALSPWVIGNLRFDETCPAAWHGYDELAYRVRMSGRRVVVTDVDTHHHTRIGFDTAESAAAWAAADEWFRRKWGMT